MKLALFQRIFSDFGCGNYPVNSRASCLLQLGKFEVFSKTLSTRESTDTIW